MSISFSGLTNRKYKKINSKVRFVGIRFLPVTLQKKKVSVLISSNFGLLSASEIEAARRSIKKSVGKNKKVRVLIRVYPYIPLTGKPSEVRMGRGKGSRIRKWVAFVKPGKILFEIHNISAKRANVALLKAGEKLSVKSKFFYVFKLVSDKFK